jgi:hypothetical protein
MASWVLRCTNWKIHFHCADINDRALKEFLEERKPDFPAGRRELVCPNCGFKNTYK